MEKVAVDFPVTLTVITMTTPNNSISKQPQPNTLINGIPYRYFSVDDQDVATDWLNAASDRARAAIVTAEEAAFQTAQAAWTQEQQRKQQEEAAQRQLEQDALLRRAEEAKDRILKGVLSGLSPEDLPAIAAALTPEEEIGSLWLIVANLALAQREEHMRNMAEHLFYHPCNTFCFGLRRKFSRQKLLEIVLACGDDAAERVAFLPPEGGSRYWTMISRNSRAYKEHMRAKAEAEA
jgi:hypothetical protein